MASVLNVLNETPLEDPETCRACGGACCQRLPGECHPSDWGAPDEREMRDRLLAAFRSRNWCVDWWEGDPRGSDYDYEDPVVIGPGPGQELFDRPGKYLSQVYYVRPARRVAYGKLRDPAWAIRSTCVLWSAEQGCSMSFEDRPLGCRSLVPDRKNIGNCSQSVFGKGQAALAWIPYQDLVKEIMNVIDHERD